MAKRKPTDSTNETKSTFAVADSENELRSAFGANDSENELRSTSGVADSENEPKSTSGVADSENELRSAFSVNDSMNESKPTSGAADSTNKPKSSRKTSAGRNQAKSPESAPVTKNPRKPKPAGASGHRERLRNRFLESNPDTIEDYHLIELLLFYSIPRKDTRYEAVELMRHFGSLRNLFMADQRELETVEGVGRSSAILIGLIHELMRRIDLDYLSTGLDCSDIDALGRVFSIVMRQEKDEVMYVIALDGAKRVLRYKKLYQSHTSAMNVFIRDITEFAISQRAEYLVISHNHPSGSVLPSYRDIELTENLSNGLKLLNIRLHEHIICADMAYYPIIRNRLG